MHRKFENLNFPPSIYPHKTKDALKRKKERDCRAKEINREAKQDHYGSNK